MPPAEMISVAGNYDLTVGLLVGAIVGLAVGMTIEQFLSQKRRAAWRARNRVHWEKRWNNGPWARKSDRETAADQQRPDAADQLRIVMSATFTVRPLLNKREARVFKELDLIVIGRNPTWQVMAQVSLGEILSS